MILPVLAAWASFYQAHLITYAFVVASGAEVLVADDITCSDDTVSLITLPFASTCHPCNVYPVELIHK